MIHRFSITVKIALLACIYSTSTLAIQPGKVSPDRTWMVSYAGEYASENNRVDFWRTHTASGKVEIYDACHDEQAPKGTAVAQNDGSWNFSKEMGGFSARTGLGIATHRRQTRKPICAGIKKGNR